MARILGWVLDLALWVLAGGTLYGAAGLIGGSWPGTPGEAEAGGTVRIYVEDNGIHTGIVLPKALLTPRAAMRFAAADLRDPRYAAHRWVAVGWGDRAFYIDTPTWGDLNPLTVAAAAIGSDRVVLHVDHVPAPRAAGSVRRVVLRPEQAARLAAFIDRSLGEGQSVPGYGGWDAFYPATGRYSAIRTCNEWTGAALRAAGVPMGRWTPFSGTVMWWL
jgi:uncharacterized protein (TIGR02117 family)